MNTFNEHLDIPNNENTFRNQNKHNNLFTDENQEISEIDLKEPKYINNKPSETLIIPLLKKFIYHLKKSTQFYKYGLINENGFALLNDKTYFPKKEKGKLQKEQTKFHKNFINFLQKYIINFFFDLKVFHPYNNLKIIWDMIHFLIILILIFLIPINVCFDLDIEKNFKIFLAIFFSGDILINLNTSYFYKGFIVKKRWDIISHYLKTEFPIDLLTLILYLIEFKNAGHLIFIKFLFLLRWQKLEKINFKLQEKFKIGLRVHASAIDLVNLLFFSFYILNIFACCWYYIAYIYESEANKKTWLTEHNLSGETLINKYFYSIYWSSVTIMTVGYGDISATNITEVIYSVFTIFFGCGLFAYFINSIGSIVQDINKESYLFKTKMAVINKYMDKKHIDYNLQMKIREYLRFIWQEESTQNAEIETEIINKLSKSLKSELIYESYGQTLRNSALFFANFSEKFLSELMYEITEVRNIPEDMIFNKNQEDECEIYFVIKGKVELYNDTENIEEKNVIKVLKEGDSFGEISFFTGHSRSCNAKSKDFTTLFSIKRSSFLSVLSHNPDDFEKFCMIKDQLIFEKNPSFLQTKCFCCFSKNHMVSHCPLLHFIANKFRIVKRYIQDPGQTDRMAFERFRTKSDKFNALFSLNYVQKSNERFRNYSKYFLYEEEPSYNQDQNEQEDQDYITVNKKRLKINTNLDKILQSPIKFRNSKLGGSLDYLSESPNLESPKIEAESLIIYDQNFQELNENNEVMPKNLSKNFIEPQSNCLINQTDHYNFDLTKRESDINEMKTSLKETGETPVASLEHLPTMPEKKLFPRKSLLEMINPMNQSKRKSRVLPVIELQRQSILRKHSTQEIDEIDQVEEKKTANDFFEKEFEKGVNFKNFYPENNLHKIIEINKKVRQIHQETRMSCKIRRFPSMKMVRNSKNNKVIPLLGENIDRSKILIKNETSGFDKSRLNLKRPSSIYTGNSEKKFFSQKHFSFYDVVYEIIHNQDLRKKMLNAKQKKNKHFN